MNKKTFQNGFAVFGFIMVVATVTLVGLVAFQFLEAQDNTEIATTSETSSPTIKSIESTKDIDTVTEQLDTSELDAIDAELSAEFDF